MAPPIYEQLQDHKVLPPRTCPLGSAGLGDAVNMIRNDRRLVLIDNGVVFEPLRDQFYTVLKQLRYERLQLHGPDPLLSDSAEDLWSIWLLPINEWARRFCFRQTNYDDWDVGMSTEFEPFDNGVLVRFVLSNVPHDSLARAQRKWFGDYTGHHGPNFDFTLSTQKECMCIVVLLPEGSFDWTVLPTPDSITDVQNTPGRPFDIIRSLATKCEAVACPYGIIADGSHIFLMDLDNPRGFARQINQSTTTCSTHLISTTEYSLTFCIAAILHRFSWSLVPSFRLCAGAAQLSTAPVPYGCNEQPANFRDFDIYQLERDRDLFVQFLDWKAGVSLQQPPVVGTVLTIEPNVIERKLFAWRITPKYHKIPIDAVTEAAVRAEDRVRDRLVDEYLSSNGTLSFEITGIKQIGGDLYSQVVVGRIGRGDQKLPHELCLKLYDERFFPVPTLDHWDAGARPWQRLVQLNFADQLLRREEAVYDRLSERQGTLLPHCYGFHEFTFPNGVRVLGALLELISAESLLALVREQWSTWSRAEKVHLFGRIRQIVRLLNHAGITQTDWHENQILCIRRPTFQAAGANRAAEIDLVLLDFAFAKQQEGFHERTEAVEDVANVQFMLMGMGLDEEAKKEIGWDERDDCEE